MAPSDRQNEIPDTFPQNYTYKLSGDFVLVKEVTCEKSAKAWLEAFKQSSKTSWTISRSYVTSGHKIAFKEQWKCHFNVQDRSNGKAKTRESKDLKCPALITATVFRVVKNSKSKLLDFEFPCQLEVRLRHNHLLQTAAVVRHNRMSEETREKLQDLFMKGHTAASAREQLKLEIYVADIDQYYEKAADNSIIPTLATVQYLFNTSFKNTYGAKSGEEMDKDLQDMLTKYNNENEEGNTVFGRVGEHKYVAICTPIMTRAHKILPQASELVFIDCSSNMDKQCHRVYMLVTPGPPGGVPLGCIITDVEKQDVFKAAVEALETVMPEKKFHGKNYPRVVMTDDDLKERNPLQELWECAILLLCQFHLLKAHWKWLLLSKHKIDPQDRQSMYFGFKRLVHAHDEETLQKEFERQMSYKDKYPTYGKYLQDLYERKKEWADSFRQHLPIRGNNTTNYVETIFRILKEIILERVKAFNLTQLVDFILVRYEGYMERRLIDFAHGRYCKSMTKKYLPKNVTDVDVSQITRVNGEDSCFLVPSKSQEGEFHLVDAAHGFCGCPAGISGRLCRHLCIVIQHFCLTNQMFIISPQIKAAVFEIATGRPPPPEWLLPLATQPQETDINLNVAASTTCNAILEPHEQDNGIEKQQQDETYNSSVSEDVLSQEEMDELDSFFKRIHTCLKENPAVFCPATRKLLKNTREFVKTDSALVSAMHTFGCYTGPKAINNKSRRHTVHASASSTTTQRFAGQAAVPSINSRHGVMIGVQPTSKARRKQSLGGKRRIGSGRPPSDAKNVAGLKCHDYTTFGRLPVNKRKAPHNLQFCVDKNVGLPTKRSCAD